MIFSNILNFNFFVCCIYPSRCIFFLIDFEKYVVEYRDYETRELLYSKEYLTDDFILSEQINIESDLVVLRIKAYFAY